MPCHTSIVALGYVLFVKRFTKRTRAFCVPGLVTHFAPLGATVVAREPPPEVGALVDAGSADSFEPPPLHAPSSSTDANVATRNARRRDCGRSTTTNNLRRIRSAGALFGHWQVSDQWRRCRGDRERGGRCRRRGRER